MSGCENFELQLGTVATTTPIPVECGNNILEVGEQCDDGNINSLDGCDSTCLAERPVCGDGMTISNSLSFDWNSEPPTLIPGVIFSEPCDDGNNITGDGCDAECAIEAGWSCFVPALPIGNLKSICSTLCGNGQVDTRGAVVEECDDRNRDDGDGCSSGCQIECGFSCRKLSGTSNCQSSCGMRHDVVFPLGMYQIS
jgi:cysteine-rich repeat protein